MLSQYSLLVSIPVLARAGRCLAPVVVQQPMAIIIISRVFYTALYLQGFFSEMRAKLC